MNVKYLGYLTYLRPLLPAWFLQNFKVIRWSWHTYLPTPFCNTLFTKALGTLLFDIVHLSHAHAGADADAGNARTTHSSLTFDLRNACRLYSCAILNSDRHWLSLVSVCDVSLWSAILGSPSVIVDFVPGFRDDWGHTEYSELFPVHGFIYRSRKCSSAPVLSWQAAIRWKVQAEMLTKLGHVKTR